MTAHAVSPPAPALRRSALAVPVLLVVVLAGVVVAQGVPPRDRL